MCKLKERHKPLATLIVLGLCYFCCDSNNNLPVTEAYLIHYNQAAASAPASNIYNPEPLVPSQLINQEPLNQVQDQQQQQLQQQQLPPSNLPSNQQQYNSLRQSQTQQQQQDLQSTRPLDNGPLFRFTVQPINSTTVKLVWNLWSTHQADRFEIKYGPIPDTEIETIKLEGSARNYTLGQLIPDTLYQFKLHGYNRDSVYKPQMAVLKTPSANYSPKPQGEQHVNANLTPMGVKAEAKSNNSIQLSWIEPDRPPSYRNAGRVMWIRYYVNPSLISTSQIGGGDTTNTTSQSPQYHYLNYTRPEPRLIIQKLKPATEYAFAVKLAYHTPDFKRMLIQSGFSMDTIAKTFDLEPSAPRNFTIQIITPSKEEQLAGQGPKLEFNWLPPESPNGQLKGYVILHSHDQMAPDDKWLRIYVNDSNIQVLRLDTTSLRPGANYYFKLRAINQRGQSGDSDTRLYMSPPNISANTSLGPDNKMIINNTPYPASNVMMLIVICLVAILFVMFLVVFCLFCRTRSRRTKRKSSLNNNNNRQHNTNNNGNSNHITSPSNLDDTPKLNGFATTNSSSTVTARVGTLARRRNQTNAAGDQSGKADYWISALEQQQQDIKSNISEKSNSDINMAAMVSIQRDSPHQFVTQTQLAPVLPEYRFATSGGPQLPSADQQLLQQIQQQQSHYHSGRFATGLGYDQMDNATASALMTLSKRQQQQLQKYQIQFATTGQMAPASMHQQAPSPHQQPPPPPPLNIEQQHHHHQQPLYGTNQGATMANTRSLRLHRPTLYDPVSGSFVQSNDNDGNDLGQPPNYNSHLHPIMNSNTLQLGSNNNPNNMITSNSNTLQFQHPHQTSTLMSRRSTNTLRSFQASNQNNNNALYGQLGTFAVPPPPPSSLAGQQPQQPQQLLQSHQAVINQLNNNSTYPSLPLKHVSAVRPQIMSSLEDQIEMELAEKAEQQSLQQQSQQQDQQQSQQQQQREQQEAIKQ